MCLGIPGRLLRVWQEGDRRLGEADFAGDRRTLGLDFLPELAVGDWTILHAGFAVSRLTAEEAQATIADLTAAGVLAASETPPVGSAGPQR